MHEEHESVAYIYSKQVLYEAKKQHRVSLGVTMSTMIHLVEVKVYSTLMYGEFSFPNI